MNQDNRSLRRNMFALAVAACMSLGVVGVSTAASAQMGDRAASDSQQPVTDTWITTKVKAELATTDGVKSMKIDVDTVNGTVHLTGDVRSDLARKKAIAAARSIKGVKQVDASGLKSMQ